MPTTPTPNMSVDTSAISAELATALENHYLTDSGRFWDDVFLPGIDGGMPSAMVQPVSSYALGLPTQDRVILSESRVSDILQPGKNGEKGWTPKGAVSFKPRTAYLNHVKADLEFTQKEIMTMVKSYYGAIRGKKYTPDEMPFAEVFLSKIALKMQEELRLAYWQAEEDPDGNGFMDLCDGWVKQIDDAILDGSVPTGNILDFGDITQANVLEYFEAAPQEIPTKIITDPDLICIVSRRVQEWYEIGYQRQYSNQTFNHGFDKKTIIGTNIPFVVEPSLDNYNTPIFIKKENLVYLYDELGQSTLDFHYDKKARSISLMSDFQTGVGIARPDQIWTVR